MTNVSSEEENVPLTVGPLDGKVVLGFDRLLSRIVFDPQNAIDVAEAMGKAAFEARGELVPENAMKADRAERLYKILVNRVTLILGSLHAKPHRYQAEQIVAACLQEVL